MPMNPLTLKNARLRRDRSWGRTIECSYTNAPATMSRPNQKKAPAPVAAPYQASSAVVIVWQTRAPQMDAGMPKR